MFSLSGEAKFVAATYRLFKSPQKRQEGSYDITYLGGIPIRKCFNGQLVNKRFRARHQVAALPIRSLTSTSGEVITRYDRKTCLWGKRAISLLKNCFNHA